MFVSQIFEECAEILGTTINEKVFRKISQAVQTLMESGHWSHSTAEVDICTGWDGCSVTLPRGVDTPLAINVDGSPVYFRNRLFQYHVNKGGMFSPVQWAWDDRGFTATAMEIIQPSQLIAIAEVENDVGKMIRVLGTNEGNIPLRSQLENGTGVDGLLVPINSVNDFPLGVILPPNQTIETRSVAIDPITRFTTTTPHQLDSGQGFNIASFTGTIPVPLSSGQVVYIGVIDAVTIQLFSDQNNAKNGNFPIELQSIINSGTLTIKDSKPSAVVTALEFPALPENEPSLPITTANPVAFPQGQTLPPPLLEKVTYFANLIDPKHLQIFNSFQDAQNNVNPVFTTGSTNPIQIDIRKEILPESKLTFAIQHFYKQGDQVQAYTAGGTLPNPLIANQNYFVNVIDEFTITLHESQADAVASTPTNPINPIKLIDAGVGTNFIVKLISSTYRSGEFSQITAPGLNIPVPQGAGANFQAVVTGSVNSVTVTSQGAEYITTPEVTFSPPTKPPVNSKIQTITATGYAILNTINKKVEQVIITNSGAGYTSAPLITIAAPIQPLFEIVSITKVGANKTIAAGNLTGIVGGTTATCTIAAHGYGDNQVVTISGVANDSEYNGTFVINYISASQFSYQTLSPITAATATGTMISTAYTGTVATATTNETTGYAVGDNVIITGADQEVFNGTKTILAINAGAKTFTFTVSSLAGSPATGTITSQKLVGTQATAQARITTSFVSYFNRISGGSNYRQSPQVEITGGGGSGATAQAVVNTTTYNDVSISRTGSVAEATTLTPHGFIKDQVVTISDSSQLAYSGDKTISSVPMLSTPILSLTRSGTVVTAKFASAHNYNTGQIVTIYGVTPIDYNGDYPISVIDSLSFSYNITNTPAIVVNLGFSSIPNPTATTFTFNVIGTPSNITGASVFSGEVTALNLITSGTGYTSQPNVFITPSTGVFIEFSSTGTLPAPLVAGTAYRIESPLETSSGTFTIKNADFSKINITGGGSGTFYTVLSRSFGVGFTNRWLGDFSSLSTGDAIYFGTDFILPTTTPSISSTVARYLNIVTSGISRVYNTEVNANAGLLVDGNTINVIEIGNSSEGIATVKTASAHGYIVNNSVTITGATGIYSGYNKTDAIILSVTADTFTYAINTTLPSTNLNIGIKVYKTSGLIQVVSFGVGQTYYGRRYSVSPLPYNNLIKPDSVVYLQDDEIVRVSTSGTSGTLPSPLVAGTDYKVKLFGDNIKLFTMNGVLIPLLNAGVGQLSVDIERIITPSKSTQIYCEKALFSTGQAISVRAVEGDALPVPMVASTTYYVRRIDENNIELYNTASNAKGTGTTGRIEFQTPGDSVESTFFIDAVDESVLVKSISQIEKPITDGFVLLYAWDQGRSNDMTLIGRYHPSEVNPQYRRLRLGKKCAWVRLAYRMSPPFITSVYDYIPVEHERAIIAAVHACDMEDKDFAEQATRYWGIAFNYLRNQQEYIDGHAMVTPQINGITYGDTTDPIIF